MTKSVPPYALVYGNPARLHGFVCECGEKLDDELRCQICGKKYESVKDGLERV